MVEKMHGESPQKRKEALLIQQIGEDELKSIGEEIANIIRNHRLQHLPETCTLLLSYLSDVVRGWKLVKGQADGF